MKMRKITSFVLTLALVLGSFSMAFAAAPATVTGTSAGLSDIAGVANVEAIQVCYDLGIIEGYPDGTFKPTQAVNRAEFAAMMTRALAIPESALTGTSTTFKDTVGYGWAIKYLAFCQSKGIMIGDGFGNVMPGRTINVNEAMTMVLRVVGYTENSSMLVGTWPSKYVTVAQNLGLYDDVATAVNVDRANAAQIIYNVLTVQKVTVNADGTTTYLTTGNPPVAATLLNTGLGATLEQDYLVDGGTYDVAKINITKNMGAYGTAYLDGSDLIAFDKTSTTLTGEMDGLKFEADGVDYTLPTGFTTSSTGNAIQNGSVADQTTTLGGMFAYADDGMVTLNVDLSGKTIKEVYSMVAWSVSDADVVATGDLEDISDDSTLLTNDFVLDDDDAIDTTQFELMGAANLDAIAKDDVVCVYADDGVIRKVAVGTDVINEKKVTEFDDGDWTIGGNVYNESVIVNADIESFNVGDVVNAKLDAYGDIYTLEVVVGTPDMYGVVTAYEPADFDDAKVRLYTIDDATKTFTIDGDEVTTALTESALIGYGLDKDGAIDSVDLTVETATTASLISSKILDLGTKTYAVASDVVVFTVDGGDYAVVDIADVDTGATLVSGSAVQYILDADDYVVAMVISAGFDTATSDGYAVVNKIVTAIDADDAIIQRVTGFVDGTSFNKYTDGSNVVTFDDGVITVYDIDMNSDGIIIDSTAISAVVTGGAIVALNSDKSAVKVGSDWYAIADNAVVYLADDDSGYTYTVSSLSSLRDTYTITLFETDDDYDGADIVIFEK